MEESIKKGEFDDLYSRAVAKIAHTHSYIISQQSKLFRSYEITAEQYNVLKIIWSQQPSSISVSFIQERMGNKMSNASRLVEKLKEKDLVHRKQCPTDRRRVDVSITVQGLKLLSNLEDEVNQLNHTMVHLSPEEADILTVLLDRLKS